MGWPGPHGRYFAQGLLLRRVVALSFGLVLAPSAAAETSVALPTIEVSAEQPGATNAGASTADPSNLPVSAASERYVTGQQVNARAYERPAEVLEAVPGLVITQHSGE